MADLEKEKNDPKLAFKSHFRNSFISSPVSRFREKISTFRSRYFSLSGTCYKASTAVRYGIHYLTKFTTAKRTL